MSNKNKLTIYNHDYTLKSMHGEDNHRFIKINVKTKYPLLESLDFFDLVFKKHNLKKQLENELTEINELTIYGCQDYLSWYLYKIAKKRGIKINIIPDNLEFFLRPKKGCFSKPNIKQLLKIILMGLYKYKFNKDYSFFQNRLIYKIEKNDIDSSNAFFLNINNKLFEKPNINLIVFISQPYYLDYNISLDSWAASINSYLLIYYKRGFTVSIKYHQRDSLKFKHLISSYGFYELDESINSPKNYIGIFSTYLFELSLGGHCVYSGFNHFKFFFPEDYINFVNNISDEFKLDLESTKPWVIRDQDFINLIKTTFK